MAEAAVAGPGPTLGREGTGLEVRVRRVPGAPIVAVRVWLPGGARIEQVPGRALVTGRLLSEGTRRQDWRALTDRVEARGMILGTQGTFESHGVALDALAADWRDALALAAEVVLEPTFPPERCAWIVRQAAAELESLGDQPEVRTAFGFLDQLYRPSRRALPLHGTAETLDTLTPADCAAFHLRSLARGVRVAVAGDIDEEAVEARVRELFGAPPPVAPTGTDDAGVPGDVEPAPPVGDPPGRRVVELRHGDPDAPQAHLYVGHLTLPRTAEDFEALEVAAVVLGAGAGLTGRIPARVREREGLAYTVSVHTVAGAGLDPGRLVLYAGTSPATVEQAERGMREELARLVEDGPTDEETEAARAWLLGREPFRRETARQWADLMAEAMHYRLPVDRPEWRAGRLAALGRAEVAAAARRHLHPDQLRVTVGLPVDDADGDIEDDDFEEDGEA
ncbi:MAG TPA: pitrilysin family protein [Thermoanaerobaculia bacterium]|nr:pitrilysin family protein [Thermoanaerobaculia bacterium]